MTRGEVEAEINACLARIGLPDGYRMPEVSDGLATPHVEGDEAPFDWVVAERGTEVRRKSGLPGPEVVFLIVEGLIRGAAQSHEARTRGDGGYSRWTWMDLQCRMMAALDPGWGRRTAARYDGILRECPLSDAEKAATRVIALPPWGDE